MSDQVTKDVEARHTLASSARSFLRDFLAFAGKRAIFAVAFVALGALLEGFGLFLVVPLIGIVSGTHALPASLQAGVAAAFAVFGMKTPLSRLAALLGLFSMLMVARAVVISTRDVSLAGLQIGFVEAQRVRIAERLAAAQWTQVARLRHSRITHLMSGDIQRIGTAAHFILQCAVAIPILVTQWILAFLLTPLLTLLALAFLVVGAAAFIPVLRRSREIGAFVTDRNLSLLSSTAHFLGGLKLAISQNLQSGFLAEFHAAVRALTSGQIAFIREQTNRRVALTTLSALVCVLLVLIGFGMFHTAPAVLMTMLVIIARMAGPVGQIQQGAQQFAQTLPAYEKVKELERELSAMPKVLPAGGASMHGPEGVIEFRNVSFHHAAEGGEMRWGVRNLSLRIDPGEMLGVTGPSGAGKTTFADLLVGLFPPQEGRIVVGGVGLEHVSMTMWRDCVSYVSQDPFLFYDTVRRNLSWANPKASEQEMWSALAAAGADGIVRRMENGLDTMSGERGDLVSGGERQRIALARAILRKPHILVLDEATSAIDVAGEREILEHLRALSPRPTIVVIAHRAESLALCDRVFRMEGGGRCVPVSPYRPPTNAVDTGAAE